MDAAFSWLDEHGYVYETTYDSYDDYYVIYTENGFIYELTRWSEEEGPDTVLKIEMMINGSNVDEMVQWLKEHIETVLLGQGKESTRDNGIVYRMEYALEDRLIWMEADYATQSITLQVEPLSE